MNLAIFLIIIVFLAAIQTAIPFLVKRTVVFGVSIPEKYIADNRLAKYKKTYSILIALISVIVVGLYLFWSLDSHATTELIVTYGTMIEFAIIFISMSLYFYFHAKVNQLKKEEKWGENVKQIKISDLSIRAQDEMLPWYVHLLPMIVTAGLIGYTIVQYKLLPEQIPTHWGINGEPDAFTEKTPISAISMPLILLALQVMFLGIHFGTVRSGIKLSATNTHASRNRQLTLRKYSSWFMFFTSLLLTMLFTFFHLTTIHPDVFAAATMFAFPFIFLIIVLVVTIIFAIKVGRADKQETPDIDENIADFDEDQYWKGGIFYFNKNDPSILVEKRFGVGWTINFANPLGYIIILLPLVIILIVTLLS
jgi:uncharacterized membrane protein